MVPLLLIACLETTTGVLKPLPEIYTRAASGAAAGAGLIEAEPFSHWDGEVVTLTVELVSDLPRPVRIDLATDDPTELGGRLREGTVQLGDAQTFQLEIPKDLGVLELQACHDLLQDGPDLSDPCDWVELEVGDDDLDTSLELFEGGLSEAIEAREPPFDDGVAVTGQVDGEQDRPLILELRDGDGALLGVWHLTGLGAFELRVPPNLGSVQLTAYMDLGLDGATVDDFLAEVELQVGAEDLDELVLLLEDGVLAGSSGMPDVPVPFEDYEGAMITVAGEVVADQDLPIDLDLRGLDSETGRMGNLGKIPLASPGPFSIDVPEDLGEIQLQAFQDLTRNGPSDDDPFGWVTVVAAEVDLDALVISLELGGKAKHAAATGPADAVVPFFDYVGDTVTVGGTVLAPGEAPVNVDVRVPDPDAPGGNRQVGKLMATPGVAFSFEAPVDAGHITLEAFQDLASDGPDDADPWGSVEVEIQGTSVLGLQIVIEAGAKAAAVAASAGDHQAPAASGFDDHEGDWVNLQVLLTSEAEGAIDLDLRAPDAMAPGGNVQVGKHFLPGQGAKSIQVPADFGTLWLEAFQDLDRDGPSPTDPYAKVELDVGDDDLTAKLELTVGGFHADGQPDQPNAEHSPDEGGQPTTQPQTNGSLFGTIDGQAVTLMGTLSVAGEAPALIDLDVFTRDPDSPGGRKYLGKLKVEPGPWTLQVPADFGVIELEALVDTDGDGPTPGDTFGAYEGNPIEVGRDNMYGLDIRL